MIGNLGGKIIFEVSDEKVLTFTEFTKTVSANWTNHKMISGKPKSEFLGAELQTITMDIKLDATLGVKPIETIGLIERMVEHGLSMVFVLGNERVGKNCWKITSVSETWNRILNHGELVSASVSLSLEESL